jgi:hypothetical protein
MRAKLPTLTLIVTALMFADASAQGLLNLQDPATFRQSQPLTFTVGASGGYDNLDYKLNTPGLDDIDSAFIQGGVGAFYTDADEITPWSIGTNFGVLNYLDDMGDAEDTYYNARLSFDIAHQVSQRLKFSNSFYVTYEVEPNFAIGASTALRNGQYFYGYENFAVSYAWSERLSTTTSYTLDGIRYQDDDLALTEDRLSHLIAQQFSYALSPRTQLAAEYRFRMTNFANVNNDFTSHYVLAGIDQAWSERTTGTIRAGAEFYKSDRVSETAPYAEFGLTHAASQKTNLNFYSSLGFDGAQLGDYDSRYSLRTGITGSHQFSERLTLNGGVHYVYSEYDGNGTTTEDIDEQQVNATAGLAYRIWNNVSLDAQYAYTLLTSGEEIREYDRNRVSLGLSAQF